MRIANQQELYLIFQCFNVLMKNLYGIHSQTNQYCFIIWSNKSILVSLL